MTATGGSNPAPVAVTITDAELAQILREVKSAGPGAITLLFGSKNLYRR